MSDKVVIFDIDDCLMPWADSVHKACVAAGLNPGNIPYSKWHMWEDYGCTKEEWLEVVNSLVRPDGLYHASPYPGAADAVRSVLDRGDEVHLVTARGFFDHADQIRAWTVEWIQAWDIPGTLWFAKDKDMIAKNIRATHALDDGVHNVVALSSVGVDTYILTQPHNANFDWNHTHRVSTVPEFVERIYGE